jgi:hypothetical protein
MTETMLDRIDVNVPCRANWAEMQGDDRVRFCGLCKLNVYNLTAMDAEEAETLVREREGRLCVRFHRRPDGTVVTKDCVKLLARVRRRVRWAAAVVLSVVGLGSAAASAAAMQNGGFGDWRTWQVQPFRTIGKALPPSWIPAEPVIMGDMYIAPPPAPPPTTGGVATEE